MFRIIRKAVKWTLITIGAVITTGGVILALLLQIDVDVKPSKQQVARAFCDMAMIGGATQKCVDGRTRLYTTLPTSWTEDQADYADGIMGN